MTGLSSLIFRLEKATGPDRSIDVDVMNLLCPRPKDEAFLVLGKQLEAKWGGVGEIANKTTYFVEAPRLTTSVDAALGLIRNKLPGWRVSTEHGDNYSIAQFKRGWGARAETLGIATCERADDEIALCIVAATLRALQSKGPEA